MVAMFLLLPAAAIRLAVLIVLYFIASGLMGLVIPTTSVLALEKHGAIAGTAPALLGTLQMLTGAVVMAVVGLFTDGRPLPMVAGMAGGALVALRADLADAGGAARRTRSRAGAREMTATCPPRRR